LGSFWVRFRALFLCFQALLSFVPTILHFFYFAALPSRRNHPANPRASLIPGARLSQYVDKMTTVIGYYASLVLSSKNKKKVKGLSRMSRPCLWPDKANTIDPDQMWSGGVRCPEMDPAFSPNLGCYAEAASTIRLIAHAGYFRVAEDPDLEAPA
jgi:hypothetical protein